MEIKTKFDIGDNVFYIENGSVHKGTIDYISITDYTKEIVMYGSKEWDRLSEYSIKYSINNDWYFENTLYPSKYELINSLIDET